MNVWEFGPIVDSAKEYADGTVVPSRAWKVKLNGKVVGEVEVHMHRRLGRDGKPDVSFGFTPVVYGPAPGGN